MKYEKPPCQTGRIFISDINRYHDNLTKSIYMVVFLTQRICFFYTRKETPPMKDNCPDQLAHQFFETMDRIAEDRKETCIHCGAVWYSIHYKNGVCHTCQQKNKPGRTVLKQHPIRFGRTILVIPLIILVVILCYLLS